MAEPPTPQRPPGIPGTDSPGDPRDYEPAGPTLPAQPIAAPAPPLHDPWSAAPPLAPVPRSAPPQPPYAPQQQPIAPQPYVPQQPFDPYAQQPYAPQQQPFDPYAQQPYAPQQQPFDPYAQQPPFVAVDPFAPPPYVPPPPPPPFVAPVPLVQPWPEQLPLPFPDPRFAPQRAEKPFQPRRFRWPRSPIRDAGKPTLRSYIVASALVFGPAAVADVFTGIAKPAPITLIWAFGIAIAMAVVNGFLWQTALGIVRKLPRFATWLVWPAAAIGLGAWLANELGAYSKLGGKDHKLAIMALVGCGVGGLFLGLLVALLQPQKIKGRGLLVTKRIWLRALFALLLLGGGGAATYVDRKYFPGTYASAHTVLRVGALWLGMFGILTTGARFGSRPLRARRNVTAAIYGLVALFPFVTISAQNKAAIHDLLEEPVSGLMFRAAREVTDIDRDGYSSMLGGGDCAPFNPFISPGAPEIPGNGIDDNCRMGDAKFVDRVADQAKVPVPASASPMSVMLITLDTVRADRLSLYGAQRDTTPNMVKIAQKAVRFDCAITSGGWTSIAVSSLMRGLYPRRLMWSPLVETSKYRLLRFPLEHDLPTGERIRLGFALPLDDPLMPLARWLQRRGMYTSAVVDDGYSEFLSAEFSSAGFDHYTEVNPGGLGGSKGDEDTANLAIQALEGMPKDKPFFLWVHFFGPHEPNSNHPGLPNWGKTEVDGYDQEIRFADLQVERLVEALDKLDRPAATIVTSDHGEIIRNAHDRDHGSDLKPEILWVPLLLRAPNLGPAVVKQPVSLVDIVPTILALTETPGPEGLDGMDLRKLIAWDPAAPPRLLHTDTWRMNLKQTFDLDLSSVSDGKLTLVHDRNTDDLVLRPVCDKQMKLTNMYGKVDSKKLEDELFKYEEENGGAPRVAHRKK
ncbi:MAG: sulfatase-like hydrolase/transferase [Polyangiaceae bacterium]